MEIINDANDVMSGEENTNPSVISNANKLVKPKSEGEESKDDKKKEKKLKKEKKDGKWLRC